jgi:hypothetical protein
MADSLGLLLYQHSVGVCPNCALDVALQIMMLSAEALLSGGTQEATLPSVNESQDTVFGPLLSSIASFCWPPLAPTPMLHPASSQTSTTNNIVYTKFICRVIDTYC